MSYEIEIKKLNELQHEASADITPCPRCGHATMNHELIQNSLSRYQDLYICNDCGLEEAFLGDLSIEKWAFTKWHFNK